MKLEELTQQLCDRHVSVLEEAILKALIKKGFNKSDVTPERARAVTVVGQNITTLFIDDIAICAYSQQPEITSVFDTINCSIKAEYKFKEL